MARFTDADLLVHRLDALGLRPSDVDLVVLSHLHYDHAGGAELFAKSELVVQRDEYAAAHYPAPFFASFYYRKNFDLPGYRWRLLDGDTELAPGLTVLRSDGHTPGHQSLLVGLPRDRAGDPVRRRLLLAGARRGRARARRGLESGGGPALHQAAEDARPPRGRADLSRPRPCLLAKREAVARRLPLTAPARAVAAAAVGIASDSEGMSSAGTSEVQPRATDDGHRTALPWRERSA